MNDITKQLINRSKAIIITFSKIEAKNEFSVDYVFD